MSCGVSTPLKHVVIRRWFRGTEPRVSSLVTGEGVRSSWGGGLSSNALKHMQLSSQLWLRSQKEGTFAANSCRCSLAGRKWRTQIFACPGRSKGTSESGWQNVRGAIQQLPSVLPLLHKHTHTHTNTPDTHARRTHARTHDPKKQAQS